MNNTKEAESLDDFQARFEVSTSTGDFEFTRSFMEVISKPQEDEARGYFDLVNFTFEAEGRAVTAKSEDGNELKFARLQLRFPTNLFSCDVGVCCEVTKGHPMFLHVAEKMGEGWPAFRANLDASNRDFGLLPSPEVVALMEQMNALAREEAQRPASLYPLPLALPVSIAPPVPTGEGPMPRGGSGNITQEEADELLAQLPNGKPDRDLSRSLMFYPINWKRNDNFANYYHEGNEGHTVIYRPSEVELALGDAPARALDLLDKRFSELKNETVPDVIDILFHHWKTYKDSRTNSVPITAAKLCEYRGKKPEGENLQLHWEALRDAFALTLRDTKSDLNAKVFFSESKGETNDGPGARYVYSPGFMLQYALSGQPLYEAPFLRKMWALDPKKNKEAKRLARYLRADWRMNTEKYLESETGKARAARWHNWEFLLTESGIDVESYRTNANGPRRLMEAMKRAVETLYQMEVIAEGGFDIYHPDDQNKARNLPPRGALDVWLSLRVCLAPSAALREALLETDGKRRASQARDAKAIATERARKQLRAEGKTKR